MPGVTILIEGTTIGCATDMDGKYSLSLPAEMKNVVLVFRFVGMETQMVKIGDIKDKEVLQGQKDLVVFKRTDGEFGGCGCDGYLSPE